MFSEMLTAQPSIDSSHPFRLRSIALSNFRSVDSTRVALRPLSVILGANSSGKSTLLQVVLAACQAIRDGSSATKFPLNGTLQSLGTYENIYNFQASGSNEPIRFGFRLVALEESEDRQDTGRSANTGPYTIEWSLNLVEGVNPEHGPCQVDSQSVVIESFRGSEAVVDYFVSPSGHVAEKSAEGIPLLNNLVKVQSRVEHYAGVWWDTLKDFLSIDKIEGKLPPGAFSRMDQQDLLGRLGIEYPVEILASIATEELKACYPVLAWGEEGSVGTDGISTPAFLPSSFLGRLNRPFDEWNENLVEALPTLITKEPDQEAKRKLLLVVLTLLLSSSNKCELQRRVGRNLEYDHWWGGFGLPEVDDSVMYLWKDEDNWSAQGIADEILSKWFVSKLSYLGPLRRSPEDRLSSGLRPGKDLGTSGEYSEAVLNSQSDRRVYIPLPDGSEEELSLGQALNNWLEWFELADDVQVLDHGQGIEFSVRPRGGSRPVRLSSVGVGVSQALPVILLCLLSEPAELLIFEQPELHLHPALQKRLADFLLVFVRAGRQILVETHSDHLVNRLRYQVASDDTDEIRNVVKLIFAEQKDGITTYRESAINEYGGLSEDWPDGFLDISARSAQDLVRQSLRKIKARRGDPAEAN